MKVTFIETSIFSRARAQHLSDEEFRLFELHLLDNPEVGDLIVGTGGCRKVRWKNKAAANPAGSESFITTKPPRRASSCYCFILKTSKTT